MNKRWEIDLVFSSIVRGYPELHESQVLTGDELQELKALDDREFELRWAAERDSDG